jgi:prevent-host-death family protein
VRLFTAHQPIRQVYTHLFQRIQMALLLWPLPKKMYRNYNEVLRDIAIGEPVFLTKNGRGKFAIIDISEYEKMKTSLKLLSQLAQGERPEKRKDG